MPLRCHEDIAVFYKSQPIYHPQYTDGEPNHPQGNGKHKRTNLCYGEYGRAHEGRIYERVPRVASTVPKGKKLPRSIIAIKKEHKSTFMHPTQKPVELIRYLIRTYSDLGGVILDNCMGSGTTAIAAIQEGRRFFGFELNKEYFDIAQRRVEDEKCRMAEEKHQPIQSQLNFSEK